MQYRLSLGFVGHARLLLLLPRPQLGSGALRLGIYIYMWHYCFGLGLLFRYIICLLFPGDQQDAECHLQSA